MEALGNLVDTPQLLALAAAPAWVAEEGLACVAVEGGVVCRTRLPSAMP